jgi:tRNA 2-thiouridine synthesizing protein C
MTVAARNKKKILLVLRRSPYGSSLARAAIDVALAAAAFDQDVDLLFSGNGVLQLVSNQDGQQLGTKTIGRLLSSLPLHDIDHVYVDADALSRFKTDLSAAPIELRALTALQIQQLMLNYDQLLGF